MYSAGIDFPGRVEDQLRNILVSFVVMWIAANVPPQTLMRFAVPIYTVGVALLVAVAMFGMIKKGARRWINVGMVIQPSEIMKIAMPLMLAWYFQKREGMLRWNHFLVAAVLLLMPVFLIARQPDLGTSLLVAAAGFYVIFLAGLSWKVLLALAVAGAASLPLAWTMMHDYQRGRVMMLIDPTSDPLGKGFHIIQSTIAIGSGGIAGKGWLKGTQAHLEFIPERTTDFIFAVFSEEFGLIGNGVLLFLYLLLIARGLDHCRQRADLLCAPAGRRDHADLLHLCVRQHGHGQRHTPGGRRAAAVHELWRHRAGDAGAGRRHPDEHTAAPQAGADLKRAMR